LSGGDSMTPKIKYILPIILIVLFPYYFKAVFESYDWLSDSKDTKGFMSLFTIIVIGSASSWFLSEVIND